jgi:NitT/TauT family transport system substrate-binding protein
MTNRSTARPWHACCVAFLATSAMALVVALTTPSVAAEHVKIGIVRSLGGAPVFVAKEKGFFDAEGLDAELVLFDAAQPIAVAATSGDIDFGTTGMTAAFFTLASQGVLKLIGAGTWEHPGFQSIGFLVSNQAYATG